MLLNELWQWGADKLARAEVTDAKWQSELLLREVLGLSRAKFMAYPELAVTQNDAERFREAIRKRSLGVPVQYILGKQEFYGRDFAVSPAVLIPRPETELLIEVVLSKVGPQDLSKVRILDLCTGSGCIGLTLAAELKQATVMLTDISEAALNVARDNGARLGVLDRVVFKQGDLFEAVGNEVFDVVVSNPPYIETLTIAQLSADVQNEPIGALDGGPDGLEFYRRIAQGHSRHLAVGGFVAVEIGHGQGAAVMELFCRAGLKQVSLIRDLALLERVVTGVFF